jgi:putative phosphoribosyl transferase
MAAPFMDRRDAGRALAEKLAAYRDQPDVFVLALPRGGVPVGYEVARALRAPLDVFLVRKLGAPGQEELAVGAIASGGVRVLQEDLLRDLGISADELDRITQREASELERRQQLYREGRPAPDLAGKTVILVDDGLATGSSMAAAARAVRAQHPQRLVIAVPVGATGTCSALRRVADDVVCPRTPEPFYAVGQWYTCFDQTTDEEVRELLSAAGQSRGGAPNDGTPRRPAASEPPARVAGASGLGQALPVGIPADRVTLAGDLTIPQPGSRGAARGVILFAHGSGSSRHSPRNRYVARVLQDAGFATLLLDLLSVDEERVDASTAELRFDIGLLARRLIVATDWLQHEPATRRLPVGTFGASTGAAAALVAAAERSAIVRSVVSRGGRPDLAGDALPRITTPTLLIVGGADVPVIELNRSAIRRMKTTARLEIVPGATHLFEEPGALEEVARLARDWFVSTLADTRAA